MTAPTPHEQAVEVLVEHVVAVNTRAPEPVDSCLCGWRPTRRTLYTASVPPTGWEEFAAHQADMLAAAGLLPTVEQWGVLYEATRDTSFITSMRSESVARKAVADSPTDTSLRHRFVTEWRTADE